MAEQILDPLTEFMSDKNKILLPNDPGLKIAYQVYGPSFQTENFLSEEGRNIFAEAIEIDESNTLKQVDDLQYLSTMKLAEDFKGGILDQRIFSDNLVLFGEKCSINLPLLYLIELECDTFWKRVVEKKSRNMLDFLSMTKNPNTNWKQEGIQLKFAELIQDTAPIDWEIDVLQMLAEKISPYVHKLEIQNMIPLAKKSNRNQEETMENIPVELCHHGSLSFLSSLTNLHTLSIKFVPQGLGRQYKREAFQHSYEDIENLLMGIKKLSSLKVLKINDSPMDGIKIDMLMSSFEPCVELEEIDFTNCSLDGASVVSLGLFIGKISTLKRIELQGNQLDEQGVRCIAYGLQNTSSTDLYLGLARNPINNEGIVELGAGLYKGRNVQELDISGANITGEGTYRISQIIQLQTHLKKLNISCIQFSENSGNELIKCLKKNIELIDFECRDCGLSEQQDFELRLLIKRNNYYCENPCMLKETFQKEDQKEIDNWLKRLKQPLLIDIEQELSNNNKNTCMVKDSGQRICPISEEIKLRVKKSTPEILDYSSYAEFFEPVEAIVVKTYSKQPKSIIKPQTIDGMKKSKDQEKELIAEQMRILTSNDLKKPYYF